MVTDKESYKEPVFDQKKYSSWLEERAAAVKTMDKSLFITISREFGCDAYPTSEILCQLLNANRKGKWLIFSHPILSKLVEDEKLGAPIMRNISEKRYTFVNWFLDGLVPEYLQSPQSQAFERMRTSILNLAEKGNCIIVGSGAQILTRELDPAKFLGIHVRLVGTFPARVMSVMQKFNMNRGDAEKFIEKKQYARDNFVEDFTGRSVTDPTLYHLTINNDLCNKDVIAKTIYSFLEIKGAFD
ncbi:MAG: AAA family ATPase [Nitrospinota bacterium]